MCRHQHYDEGRPSYGGNIPDFANGTAFPGDQAGPRCGISGDCCAGGDSFSCPRWRPSAAVCPDCLEFRRRRWPVSLFRESPLLLEAENGRYRCPACEAEYAGLEAVLQSATNRLRDLLDDADCTEGQLLELLEKLESH